MSLNFITRDIKLNRVSKDQVKDFYSNFHERYLVHSTNNHYTLETIETQHNSCFNK
jgi:hypothetical protein